MPSAGAACGALAAAARLHPACPKPGPLSPLLSPHCGPIAPPLLARQVVVSVVGIDVLYRVQSRDLMSLKLEQGRVAVDQRPVTRASGGSREGMAGWLAGVRLGDSRTLLAATADGCAVGGAARRRGAACPPPRLVPLVPFAGPRDVRLHLAASVQDVVVRDLRARPEHRWGCWGEGVAWA